MTTSRPAHPAGRINRLGDKLGQLRLGARWQFRWRIRVGEILSFASKAKIMKIKANCRNVRFADCKRQEERIIQRNASMHEVHFIDNIYIHLRNVIARFQETNGTLIQIILTSSAGCLLTSGISSSLFPDGGHVGGHVVYKQCAGCAAGQSSRVPFALFRSKICCIAL